MAKSRARVWGWGLGKFSDQSLADYWYGDIAEISVSNAPKYFINVALNCYIITMHWLR